MSETLDLPRRTGGQSRETARSLLAELRSLAANIETLLAVELRGAARKEDELPARLRDLSQRLTNIRSTIASLSNFD